MGIRRRVLMRRRYEITDEVRIAARHLERWEEVWGGTEEGRAAWATIGQRLIRSGPFRPAVWWAYTPGVPDMLRQEVEPPDPRPPLPVDPREWRAHQVARWKWLIASGHLEPDEIRAAEERLALATAHQAEHEHAVTPGKTESR